MKTLPVCVYRSAGTGDCTNGGISASQDRLYLICDQGFHDVPDGDPRLIRLVQRTLPWRNYSYLHVEPVNDPPLRGRKARRPHVRGQLRVLQRLPLPCGLSNPHPRPLRDPGTV